MTSDHRPITVLIASPLEEQHVQSIRHVDPRLRVIHRTDLIGQPRYPADHVGDLVRTGAKLAEWERLLKQVDVMLDFDQQNPFDLAHRAPLLRWIQATSSGVGQFIWKSGLDKTNITVTNAAGVHAVPLAEYVIMTMLIFTRRFLVAMRHQQLRRWERFTTPELTDKVVVVIGLGRVGREVATRAKAFGMTVIGTKRDIHLTDAERLSIDEVFPATELKHALARADFVVLAVPQTRETENLLGKAEFGAMKRSAVVINIARGAVVDEGAMIDAIESGKIAGAALDVFETEPLPDESPLWRLPNVLVTSHCMSNSERENGRITSLFCTNLRRFLDDQPLINVVDKDRGY